nr:biotin/lipoyl-binding protein [Prochloraceae cyanobacterium]
MEIPVFGRKLNSFRPSLLGLAAVGTLMIGVVTYKVIQSPKSQSQLEQLTVSVKKQNLRLQIEASGTVEPRERVKISPKTSGRLEQLLVEQGDRVNKGQTLAIMESDRARADLDQAKANLQQAEANLAKTRIATPEEIKQAEARFNAALASLNNARARIPRQIEQARA